jgi:hypothetical protein
VGGLLVMLYAGAVAAGAVAGQDAMLFGGTLTSGAESYVVLVLAGARGPLAGALVGWASGAGVGVRSSCVTAAGSNLPRLAGVVLRLRRRRLGGRRQLVEHPPRLPLRGLRGGRRGGGRDRRCRAASPSRVTPPPQPDPNRSATTLNHPRPRAHLMTYKFLVHALAALTLGGAIAQPAAAADSPTTVVKQRYLDEV